MRPGSVLSLDGPDPYIELNSLLVEWVPARSWVFRKAFTPTADQIAQLDNAGQTARPADAGQSACPASAGQSACPADSRPADPLNENRMTATLVFQGIDYAGDIFLNGISLGRHEGMFVPFTADVTRRLREGSNLVAVALDPAPAEQPQVGRTSLTRTMKSRMTYWWDFCPRMIRCKLPINGSFPAGDVTLRTTGSTGDLLLLRLILQDNHGIQGRVQ